MTGSLPSTTDATFEQDVLRSPLPVLVDFTAEWCGPCRRMTPVLEQLARDHAGRLRVVALDVDANPRTALAYGVLGMPTMTLFRDGRVVTELRGARPGAAVMTHLEPHLDGP